MTTVLDHDDMPASQLIAEPPGPRSRQVVWDLPFDQPEDDLVEDPIDDDFTDEEMLLQCTGRYQAYARDLGFAWRWEIHRDDEGPIQFGGSLTLGSAREAVGHVLAYFCALDANPTPRGEPHGSSIGD